MQFSFFYFDALSEGGAPNDIRSLCNIISKDKIVDLYCVNKGHFINKDKYKLRQTNSFLSLMMLIISNKDILRLSKVIVLGGFIWKNIFIVLLFYILRIKFQFIPFSHFTSHSLANKIVNKNPLISNGKLEANDKNLNSSFKKIISKLIKNIYFYTFGKIIIQLSEALWVSSIFERNQIISSLPNVKTKPFVFYSFGLNTNIGRETKYNYSDYKNYTNLVFWGRVDYFNKGLDRLLNAIEIENNYFVENKILFHIIGPSYNGGKTILNKEINSRGLSKIVKVPDDKKITSIDLGGLVNADGTILLSRWEGHPRVLRESIYYKVPALISPETNFCDVNLNDIEFLGGVGVKNPDDSKYTLLMIKKFLNNIKNHTFLKNDKIDITSLKSVSWKYICMGIIKQVSIIK